jgi:prepilin-type N-terminal cleavage/methylation domain-containing protein
MRMRRAFTLIELLVVISIIALLIAILLPVLSNVKYESANFLCVNRQRQWAIAANTYTTDNKELYPDRGIDNTNAGEWMWARWAARMWIQRTVDGNLDEVMGQYMSEEIAVWCCPQYDGAHGKGAWYGCLEHGKSHRVNNDNNDRWTTYAFHGGLNETPANKLGNVAGNLYNPGGRRKIGDPYVIELASGERYESNILISDTGSGDNAWTPAAYPNAPTGRFGDGKAPFAGITTNHQPNPGTEVQVIRNPKHGLIAVNGKAYYNFANDDGSAESRTVTVDQGMNSDEWTPVQADGGRYMLFPN